MSHHLSSNVLHSRFRGPHGEVTGGRNRAFARRFGLLAAVILSLSTLLAAPAVAEDVVEDIDGRYSFLRVVDGEATLVDSEGTEEAEAVANYPVLTGDRLVVDRRSRVDVILSDGSQVALDGDSEILFANLSGSPDRRADDEGTLLQLVEGELYLQVGLDRTSAYYPIVDTANARVYVQEDGVYRFEANDHDFSQITVVDGSLEVVTRDDEILVLAGESLAVDGSSSPRLTRLRANYDSALQAWAENQEARFDRHSSSALETYLPGTADLDRSGDWVTVDAGVAWKPRVESTWRPYYRGRWTHTPSGLFWVSDDPWLPVTYRYGTWDLHPRFGWVWYPGYRYRTAHVYWYWGPSYAAWIPSGYYTRYYGPRYSGFGFRAGVIGYAGFHWDPFDDWLFCPVDRIGYRDSRRWYHRGSYYRDHGYRLDRGIITTSTRGLGRDHWQRPALISAALERGWRADRPDRDLPDASSLVARASLSPRVQESLLTTRAVPTGERVRSEQQAARGASSRRSELQSATRGRGVDVDRGATSDRRSSASASSRSSRTEAARSGASSRSSSGGATVERRATPSSTRSTDSSRGAVRRSTPSTRSDDAGRGSVRREATPSAARPTTSSRGAVRRSSPSTRPDDPPAGATRRQEASSTPRRSSATSGASSSRGAVRRTMPPSRSSSASSGGAVQRRSTPSSVRQSSPARRVIDSAGSRSNRSSSAAVGSRSSSSSTRSSTATRRPTTSTPPPRARSSSGTTGSTRRSTTSSSRRREATPPPSRSSARSSSGRSSTVSRSSARTPSRPAASRPSSTSRRSSTRPPARRSSASASTGSTRSDRGRSGTVSRSRQSSSAPRTSVGSRSSSPSRERARTSRPSASSSRSQATTSRPSTSSRSRATTSRPSTSSRSRATTSRSSASSGRRSTGTEARSSSSRSGRTGTRSSSRRPPPLGS